MERFVMNSLDKMEDYDRLAEENANLRHDIANYKAAANMALDTIEELKRKLAEANAEVLEQCCINGMGAEREDRLRAQVQELERERDEQRMIGVEQGRNEYRARVVELEAEREGREKQEPFCMVEFNFAGSLRIGTSLIWSNPDAVSDGMQLFARPVPERSLTDVDIERIASTPAALPGSYVHSFARAIEQFLKGS